MHSVSMSTMNGVKQDAVGGADAKESTTIRFEWTLRNLKNLFENRFVLPILHICARICHLESAFTTYATLSKGEAKSKVTKSPRFGDGRWQVSAPWATRN